MSLYYIVSYCVFDTVLNVLQCVKHAYDKYKKLCCKKLKKEKCLQIAVLHKKIVKIIAQLNHSYLCRPKQTKSMLSQQAYTGVLYLCTFVRSFLRSSVHSSIRLHYAQMTPTQPLYLGP